MPRFQLGPFAWILTVLLFASAVRAEDLHFKKNISFAGSPVSSSEVWIREHGSEASTVCQPATSLAGTAPIGVAFDGVNIWVANSGDNTLTKLRASDGANLGTFPTGTAPHWLVFDGAHIWVTNNGSNTVTKY